MEGLQPPEEESESEEEDDAPAKKAVAKAKAAPAKAEEEEAASASEVAKKEEEAAQKKAEASDSDSDVEKMPDGVFHQVIGEKPNPLFRQPQEGDEDYDPPFAALPPDTFVRGFDGEWRPEGWLELAPGGAWMRTGGTKTKPLGAFLDQPLRNVVQTTTPVVMVKRWTRNSPQADNLELQDLLQVQDIGESRVRMLVEELLRERVGEETFNRFLDEAAAMRASKRERIKQTLGIFCSQNGCLWTVTPAGQVRGLHPDGSRIRDKIELGPSEAWKSEDCVRIGPFKLDEGRTCSCLHWLRQEDPSGDKAWVWQRDMSLHTKVQLGTSFPGA